MQLRAAAVHAVGQGHFSQGLAVAGPQRAQRPERWAEINPRLGPGPVELGEVDGGEICLELLQLDLLGAHRGASPGRHGALGVLGPSVLAVGPAEDLEPARRSRVDAVEHQLHLPATSLSGILRVGVVEDHRAVELEVLHRHRPGRAGRCAGRDSHGAVQRARRDHPPVHSMIVQPPGVVRVHLGGVQDLTPR